MDIFVIKIESYNNVPQEMLNEFKKREISNSKRLKEHCFAYLMIDRVLREFYQFEDREIIFENKKPILKSGKKHFSLSHSGDYLALCFSDNPCGIDIEEKTERDFEKIAQRMKFDCANIEEFYSAWTQYEAEYKLAEFSKSCWTTTIENYTLTALSSDEGEEFTLYLQNN